MRLAWLYLGPSGMGALGVGKGKKLAEALLEPCVPGEMGQSTDQRLLAYYFLIQLGLLYHHKEPWGQLCNLLVVPCSKYQLLMPMLKKPRGHHVAHNTLEKLHNRFIWPSMESLQNQSPITVLPSTLQLTTLPVCCHLY